MKIIIKSKTDKPCAYTYLLKFNINNNIKYYYGVRYSNIRHNRLPIDDLFVKYFTSSKIIKKLIKEGTHPTEVIIHKCFSNVKDALEFERNFLLKVNATKRKDFINQTHNFNTLYSHNAGRIKSKEEKEKMSIISSLAQPSEEYRKKRSESAKKRWTDPSYREYMEKRNSLFYQSEEGKEFLDKFKNRFKGKKHTPETKEKIGKKSKINGNSPDFKKRMEKWKKYECSQCNKIYTPSNFHTHLKKTHFMDDDQILEVKKSSMISG
jgi:hypothetical protein